MSESEEPEQEYAKPDGAVFYAVYNAETPLTFEEIAERPETNGHDEDAIRDGIDERNLATREYGDITAYYLDDGSSVTVHITREMYEQMLDRGSYIGEDPYGVEVHLREEFASVGPKHPDEDPSPDAWGPVFPESNPSEPVGTENVTESSSAKALLEADQGDTIAVTEVHTGCRLVPEHLEVTRRTNTFFGPAIDLKADEGYDGQEHGWQLTCPDSQSHPVLWRSVADHDGYTQTRIPYATVTVDLRDVTQYDICEGCGEPIRDPMHRSLAMMGQCNGGFEEGSSDGE